MLDLLFRYLDYLVPFLFCGFLDSIVYLRSFIICSPIISGGPCFDVRGVIIDYPGVSLGHWVYIVNKLNPNMSIRGIRCALLFCRVSNLVPIPF